MLDDGPRLAAGLLKVFVGVKHIVTEKFVQVSVKILCAGFQNGVDVAPAVASLARVVERSLHLEFLDDVRIGQRHVSGLRHVVIGRADSFDQIVVVVFPLPVDDDAHVAAPELRGGVQLALRSGGKREQLLVVLRGEGKFADGCSADGLASGGVSCFHGGDAGGNLDLFRDRAGLEGDGHLGRLRDANFDLAGLGLRKTGLVDDHGVGSGREERHDERAVRVGQYLARKDVRARVNNLDFGSGDSAAAGIHHGATDGTGCPALGEDPGAGKS